MDEDTIESDANPERTRLVSEALAADGTAVGVDLPADATVRVPEAQTDAEAIAGTLIRDSRYEIRDLLARGGMGAVLRARDVNCRRLVAMKVMLERRNMTPQQVVRFIEEAQVTAQLEHPSIVPVHELGVDDGGNVFYTMKYVRGLSLKSVLASIRLGDAETIRDYPLARLLAIYMKACEALAFAHSRQVVHRDLKPENIMLGDFGEVLVVDWGLAKILGRPDTADTADTDADADAISDPVESIRVSDEGDSYRTLDGVAMGTPRYMAPEQAHGRISQIDGRTDIYALGGILYAMLTLRPPIKGESVHAIMANVMRGEIEHPSIYSAETATNARPRRPPPAPTADAPTPISLAHIPGGVIPPSLAAVAMKALSLEQADRYPTVADLQGEIEAYLGGFATQAEDAGLSRQLGLLVRRHRAPVAVAAAALVLLVVLVAAFVVRVSSERDRATAAQRLAEASATEARAAEAEVRDVSREAAPAFVLRAEREFAAGDLTTAAQNAQIAVRLDPDNSRAWAIRGRSALALLDLPTADDAFAQHLALLSPADPGYPQARTYLHAVEALAAAPRDAATGQPVQTAILAQSARLSAGDPHLAALLRQLAGQSALDVLDRANAALDRVATANPDSARGRAYLKDQRLVVEFVDGARILDLRPLASLPIAEFTCTGAPLTDLAPLVGMPLTAITLRRCARIDSLAALSAMPLHTVAVTECPVSDLTPLAGHRLTTLLVSDTQVSDLTPLTGMPITTLGIGSCPVRDLAPLRDMPLGFLYIGGCPVTDLAPLRGMPLRRLLMGGCRIHDLSPLAGLPLASLDIRTPGPMPGRDYTPLRDLPLTELMTNNPIPIDILTTMPLKDLITHIDDCADIPGIAALPLATLRLTVATDCDLSPLRDLPALTTLNGKPAPTFWRDHDTAGTAH